MSDAAGEEDGAARPGRVGFRIGNNFFLHTPCADASEIRVVVCGQSHARSLFRAITAEEIGGVPVDGAAISRRLGIAGLAALSASSPDAETRQAASMVAERHLAVVWKGGQHNGDFLFPPEPPLDFVASADPDAAVDESAILVPEAAIRERYQPSIAPLETLLQASATGGGWRRFVLGTPAPLADADLLRQRLAKHRFKLHPRNAARVFEAKDEAGSLPITPAPLRRKLWLVLQDLLAEAASRNGAEFIPVPAASLDAQGCLDPRFSAGDLSHGNTAFGLLMLRDLAARLSAPDQEAARA